MPKYLPSTSRVLDPTNYAWDSIVYQAGRPMLDSELNLTQDILNKKNTLPSGMISYQGQDDLVGAFEFQKPWVDPTFSPNTFTIKAFKAMVNGIVVDVQSTNNPTSDNRVTLPPPDEGSSPSNRADFVFLEVWRREVTPAMQSRSRVRVFAPLVGDSLTFSLNGDSLTFTAVANAPANANEFQIGASLPATARNLALAITDYRRNLLGDPTQSDGFILDNSVVATADTRGTEFVFISTTGGSLGTHNPNDPLSYTITSSNRGGLRILTQALGGSDGEGKPNANQVYFLGNVLSDPSLYLDDNTQDLEVIVSSTRRVQVQYRIRSFSNTNLSDQIFGFENTDVLAQGSTNNPVLGKNFTRHPTDHGLWIAGDGSEADAGLLGTVDGHVYAIPLCYVFRRFSAVGGTQGFNAIDYFNTGALHDHDGLSLLDNDYVGQVIGGESDRPDGLFADEIARSDVLDLRRRVYPRGIDFSSELEYQYHTLLDNENRTWYAKAHHLQTTGNGSGGTSSTPLVCDIYGRNDPANIGNAGQHRSIFDHIARRWSDAPTTERIYLRAYPENIGQSSTGVSVTKAPTTSGDYWCTGDKITIDLTALKISGHLLWEDHGTNTFSVDAGGANAPKLLDVGYCWHNDGNYDPAKVIDQQVLVERVTGLGTNTIEILLGNRDQTHVANGGLQGGADYKIVGEVGAESTGSEREIFIELIFDYPALDRGLSGVALDVPTPSDSAYPTGPASVIVSAPTNAYDPYPTKGNVNAPAVVNIETGTKEVSLEYIYNSETISIVTQSESETFLPWRLWYSDDPASQPSLTDQSGGGTTLTLDNNNTSYQHAESKIAWSNSGSAWNGGQRLIEITAYPIEPYPYDTNTDSTILVYYHRSAPMTAGSDFPLATSVAVSDGGSVPNELRLQPLAVGKEISVYLKTNENYPFFNPADQLGTHKNAQDNGYVEFKSLSNPNVFLDDLRINTGSVNLPSFVPFVSSVIVTLGDTTPSKIPVKDNQSRVVYPTMEDASYFPSAFAKNMSGYHSNYKTALPCLMKITDDNHALYRKGEVVLVVFVKTSTWGQGVAVDMREDVAENYVVACVYRTKNQLLLGE